MSARPVLPLALFGLAASLAGCLLDAGPYPSGDGGAGASIHTGGSGGASTTGGSSGTTSTGGTTGGSGGMTTSSTTSSTSGTCTVSCDDSNPCTEDACENGVCSHKNAMLGTFVSNLVGDDCKEEVCDGNGGITSQENNQEKPSLASPSDCQEYVCKGQQASLENKADGSLCFGLVGPCQSGTICLGGQCAPVNLFDGFYGFGDCGTVHCVNGTGVGVTLNDSACVFLDLNPVDCLRAICENVSDPTCSLTARAQGSNCTKDDLVTQGNCNDSGVCE